MDDIPEARLLDRSRAKIRVKHYSIRTEHAYPNWIKRFVIHHGKRHPAEPGAGQVEAFLSCLAVEGQVASSTQNQAKSALLFLYREVPGIDLPWLERVDHAKASLRMPVVPTRDEVARVLARLRGTRRLLGRLLYGTGMRIMEGVRLRAGCRVAQFGRCREVEEVPSVTRSRGTRLGHEAANQRSGREAWVKAKYLIRLS